MLFVIVIYKSPKKKYIIKQFIFLEFTSSSKFIWLILGLMGGGRGVILSIILKEYFHSQY